MPIEKSAPLRLLEQISGTPILPIANVIWQCSETPTNAYLMVIATDGNTGTLKGFAPLHMKVTGGGSKTLRPTKKVELPAELDCAPGVEQCCPSCSRARTFHCSCGVISCMTTNATKHTCPSCNHHAAALQTVTTLAVDQPLPQQRIGQTVNKALPKSALRIERKK